MVIVAFIFILSKIFFGHLKCATRFWWVQLFGESQFVGVSSLEKVNSIRRIRAKVEASFRQEMTF